MKLHKISLFLLLTYKYDLYTERAIAGRLKEGPGGVSKQNSVNEPD